MAASSDTEGMFEAIRRAALEPEAWFDVQERTAAFMGAFSCQLASVDHAHGNATWTRTTRRLEYDDYFCEFMPDAEPVHYAMTHPNWRVFCDYDYIDEPAIARSEFYRLCQSFNLSYRLGLRLVDTPDVSRALVFLWRTEQGHVQAQEFEKLAQIEQQLRLAAHVSSTLSEAAVPMRGLLEGLEHAAVAAAITEPGGRVLHANGRAEAIFRAGDGLGVRRGHLEAGHPASFRQLVALMAGAGRTLRDDAGGAGGGTIRIPRPSRLAPYAVTVAPLSQEHRFLAPDRWLLLVLIRDPAAAGATAAAEMRKAFGLTAAEEAICEIFARGAAIPEIAASRGVADATVRQQVKTIMSKLGVSRQAELMRLLLTFQGQ